MPNNGAEKTPEQDWQPIPDTEGNKVTVQTPNFVNIVNRPFANVSSFEILGAAAVLGGVIVGVAHGLGLEWKDGELSTLIGIVLCGLVLMVTGIIRDEGEG